MLVGKRYSDLTSLHKSIVLDMARSPRRGSIIDDIRGSAAVSFTNLVIAKSAEYDFDLGDAGFTAARWRTFVRQYVDVEQFHSWVRQAAQTKKNGAELVFLAKPIGRIEKVTLNETSTHLYGGNHRWGNCLLGMTFGFKPHPLIVMHSRTSALTRGGTLDLTLADITAREMAKTLGISQSDITFAWMASSFQVSVWHLLTLAAAWGLTEKIRKLDTPVGHGFNRYVERGAMYGIKHMSTRRTVEAAAKIKAGTMGRVPVSSLEVK